MYLGMLTESKRNCFFCPFSSLNLLNLYFKCSFYSSNLRFFSFHGKVTICFWDIQFLRFIEAIVKKCSWKKVFLEISQFIEHLWWLLLDLIHSVDLESSSLSLGTFLGISFESQINLVMSLDQLIDISNGALCF